MRGHNGHVLIWLTAGLALMVILGVVAFFMLQGNEGKEGAPPGALPQESKKDESSQVQPVEEMPGGKDQGDEGEKRGSPVEEGGPCGNERSLQVAPSPPIESGEEAFALLVQRPEVRDWYWSVEQPRFQAWDEGDRFLIKLYALLPAEGSLPERQAVFGQYHVLKSSGETIRAD